MTPSSACGLHARSVGARRRRATARATARTGRCSRRAPQYARVRRRCRTDAATARASRRRASMRPLYARSSPHPHRSAGGGDFGRVPAHVDACLTPPVGVESVHRPVELFTTQTRRPAEGTPVRVPPDRHSSDDPVRHRVDLEHDVVDGRSPNPSCQRQPSSAASRQGDGRDHLPRRVDAPDAPVGRITDCPDRAGSDRQAAEALPEVARGRRLGERDKHGRPDIEPAGLGTWS